MPTKVGIQWLPRIARYIWIPAFAGMTVEITFPI